MIPRIIHYCWFGRGEMPADVRRYIDGWRQLHPEYQIIEWNEDNFPIDFCAYSAEAYAMHNWAFVSDVCRMYALSIYGGFYLDTDIELLKSLEPLRNNRSFGGEEVGGMAMGVVGAEPNTPWINRFLDFYIDRHFVNAWGHPVRTPNPTLFKRHILPGLKADEMPKVYPRHVFYPYLDAAGVADVRPDTVCVHHYTASWRRKRTLLRRLAILSHGLAVRWLRLY